MNFDASIELQFSHRLRFTHDALDPANDTLATALPTDIAGPVRVIVFMDAGLLRVQPSLPQRVTEYADAHRDQMTLAGPVQPVVGGELCKNDRDAMYRILNAIDTAKLDRRSCVLAVGGGAVLDCVGFAASIAHRGMPLVRIPSTTLAQADSCVGGKNGINGFGKNNYLGSLAVPHEVINDPALLTTLADHDWIAGLSEAVKVALLKDATLFSHIEQHAARIAAREMVVALPVIERSAQLHLEHIATGGDPFELAEARPLDFGHWAAHKLEAMTDFTLSHGHAVAIGLAIDTTYAHRTGLLSQDDRDRIHSCLAALGFSLHHDAMRDVDNLLAGLEEFREHLGGRLTIPLLRSIAQPTDVHEIDHTLMRSAIADLTPLPTT